MKTKKKLFLAMLLSAAIIACNSHNPHKDYSRLIGLTTKNKAEVKKLIYYYLKLEEKEKIKAFDYILENLPDQYSTSYYLLKVAPDLSSEDTVWLKDQISYDTVALRIKNGYELRGNITKDIDVIKSEDLVNHIEISYNRWKNKIWNKDVAFRDFVRYLLPYRAQNETLDKALELVKNRYTISDMLNVKLDGDTIEAIGDFASNLLKSLSKDPKGVEFLSNPSYHSMFESNKYLTDYEDMNIFKMKLLRDFGILSTTRYSPGQRNFSTSGYWSPIIYPNVDGKLSGNENVSKMYQLSAVKREWTNPYDKLLSLGISAKNIPLALFIPKMRDITSEVTIAKNVLLPVPDSVLKNKAMYLCNYTYGDWRVVAWGKVNEKEKSVIFNKMGTDMLYQMASFKSGTAYLIGDPFILDSSGKISALNYIEDKPCDLILSEKKKSGKLDPMRKYNLYRWGAVNHKWHKLQTLTARIDSSITASQIGRNGLYALLEDKDDLKDGKFRIFTIDNNKKQIWW